MKGIRVDETETSVDRVELTDATLLLSPEFELVVGSHFGRVGEEVLRIYSKSGSYVGTLYPGIEE